MNIAWRKADQRRVPITNRAAAFRTAAHPWEADQWVVCNSADKLHHLQVLLNKQQKLKADLGLWSLSALLSGSVRASIRMENTRAEIKMVGISVV